jgi:hypothetical protein
MEELRKGQITENSEATLTRVASEMTSKYRNIG